MATDQLSMYNTPELSRADKMRISRKKTTDLTRWCIEYLNSTGQFTCHRSNNTPSTRVQVIESVITGYFDAQGKPVEIPTKEVKHSFKAGNIKTTILDISGFVTAEGINPGVHIELEVKTGKDELSENQVARIKDIQSAGGISFAFSDKETFLFQIKPFIKPKQLAF